MKLVYVQNEYPVLSQTFVSNEISELRRRGIDVYVVASRRGARFEGSDTDQPDLVLNEVGVRRLLTSHARLAAKAPRVYARYLGWLARRGPSFLPWAFHVPFIWSCVPYCADVHIHTHFATRAAGVAEGLREILGATRSVTLHASDLYSNPRLSLQIENASLCTVTEHNQRYLEALNLDNGHLVRCGLDLTRFESSNRDRVESGLLVSVGRLVPKKGHDRLIRWLGSEAGSPYRLRIVGSGPEHGPLADLVEDLGLSDRVQLVGAQPPSAVIEEVSRADVFALACRVDDAGDADGLPVVLLEAALIGTPVVSTNVTGISEFLSEQTGYLAQHDDETDLHRALLGALTDPARDVRARRARALVMEKFTVQAQVDALIRAISQARDAPVNDD